ncbi:MAG: DUF932 domain-containing protein [Opitutaceae bacterium]
MSRARGRCAPKQPAGRSRGGARGGNRSPPSAQVARRSGLEVLEELLEPNHGPSGRPPPLGQRIHHVGGKLGGGEGDLRRCAPSAFAENARPGVSPRYSFVSTAQVVALLRDEGWVPVKAQQQPVRLPERQGFQMHVVRFARRDDLDGGALKVGECRPELILQNAHDGTRAYRIDAGLYRLVCRNGLVVADADFAHVAIRHLDVAAEKFAAAAQAVAVSTPRVLDAIARWQAVELTELTQQEFARRAAALRWTPEQPVTRLLGPAALLAPVRYGDDKRDLWKTFNVVQLW